MKFRCSNGKPLKIPQVDTYIMVLTSDQPTISLNGTPNLAREYEAFMQGIELFSTVSVIINQEQESESDDDSDEDGEGDSDEDASSSTNNVNKLMSEHKLDKCTVQVYPPLNPDHEYFRLPNNFMSHLGIQHKETKDGIVIYGKSLKFS